MERRTTPFVPDFSTPEGRQGRLATLSAMTTGAVDGFDSRSCTGACATCPNRGKCSVQQGGAGCTGACATCPNRDTCAAQTAQEGCSGACATCPNRDKCGFKTRLRSFPHTHTFSQLRRKTLPFTHPHTYTVQLRITARGPTRSRRGTRAHARGARTASSARRGTGLRPTRTRWRSGSGWRRCGTR